ncbi:PEGA domain-containing protein [Hyalangium minutum]|uniref:PEGA domain-containing protein n=1 Tax=Hyalangium minutum TaxID=394096 RepID=A0A085W7B9_9BACT|nr:PEGA domain-containing protein [Hyalangium minutum]KFE63582.1 hypothetical protein DB31_2700 [Hyalangium minutum]
MVGLLASGPALAQQPVVRLLPRVLPSAAAPTLTVLVVPLDAAAQAQLPQLTYQAEQAVAGTERFQLVRLADALDAQGARERDAKAAAAAAALQEGQKAYDELDTQQALKQFDQAAQLYEGSDLSRHFMDMSRARVMKIAAYVANGDNKAFQRELKEVLARNPRAEFSSNFFPPDELAVVEKVRRGILAEATRTLEVKTGDVPAQIFMDGQFQGISPMTLSGLTSSEHFVTAIAPGYASAQGRFRGEAALKLEPLPTASKLKAWVDRIAAAPEGADRDAALRELGTFAGTQQVMALLVRGTPSISGQDAIALRVEVSDGHNAGYAVGPLPLSGDAGNTALQALLASVLQTDALRGKGGKPTTHYPTQGPSAGRKTAGYVLLATGAALVAGGIYFGLEASSKADDFKKLPQRDPRAEKLRSDGKTYALVADVGVIAGLASAGAGTWLAFLGGGDGADSGGKKGRVTPAPAPRPETAPAARPEDKPATPAATGKTQDKPATAPAAGKPEDKPAAAPPAGDKATPATAAPQGKSTPASRAEEEKRKREEEKKRAEEERLKREEEERLKREEEAKRKQAEEDKRKGEERLKREEEEKRKQEEERKKREEEEKKKREEEAKRKREEEERRKREEEEKKKKKPALDEDDLRNY